MNKISEKMMFLEVNKIKRVVIEKKKYIYG